MEEQETQSQAKKRNRNKAMPLVKTALTTQLLLRSSFYWRERQKRKSHLFGFYAKFLLHFPYSVN